MGQAEVYTILLKNPGAFISAKELSQLTGTKIQSILANIKALEKDDEIKTKTLAGVTNHRTKFVAFVPRDTVFEAVLKDFTRLKLEGRFAHSRHDYLQNFMLLAELRKLREEIKNGRK